MSGGSRARDNGPHPRERRQEPHVRDKRHARKVFAEHLLRAGVALALQYDVVASLQPLQQAQAPRSLHGFS